MTEPKYTMRQAYGSRVDRINESFSLTMMVGEQVLGTVRLDPELRVFADSFMGWRIDRYIVHRGFGDKPFPSTNRRVDFRLAVDRVRETGSAIALWHAFDERTAMQYGAIFHRHVGVEKGRSSGGWRFTKAQLFAAVLEAREEERRNLNPNTIQA